MRRGVGDTTMALVRPPKSWSNKTKTSQTSDYQPSYKKALRMYREVIFAAIDRANARPRYITKRPDRIAGETINDRLAKLRLINKDASLFE